ncbi:AMP-binding protein [Glaciibacter sp. 2TAF33]|uniref:AMP-binding protein n=1 Tax=Glaciibacter sp. 2TAF33 TaxID=3233015 RepID=UPI003F925FCE
MMEPATSPAAGEAFGPYTREDIERYYDNGDWQHQVLFDIVADRAMQHPDRIYVTDGTTSVSYGQLRADAIRLAAGIASLGVARGDRVAVQTPNWAEFATITVALSRLGAVLVPIMPIFRGDEVGYILRHSGAKVIIGPDTFHNFDFLGMYLGLLGDLPELTTVLIARPENPAGLGEALDLASVYAGGEIDELDATLGETATANDGCLVVYTSGTTARPKGCFHTFNTLYASSIGMIRRLGVTADDVFFNASPVTHSTGLVTGMLIPLITGGATHFVPAWTPAVGLDRIKEYRCTITFTSTTFLAGTMQAFEADAHDISSMRYWVCAGAPIPGAVVQEARTMFPDCAVLSLYGRSENMVTSMCGPDDPPERSVLSDGHALPDAMIKVVDIEGTEVPRGATGDLAYRGPSHMLEYYQDPQQTAALYTGDGFSRSGDIGVMDQAGYIRVSGRIKDIIIRGGVNISSREIEDLLLGHPAVRDVAIVAMPDRRLGERLCAFVVPTPGLSLPDLAHLAEFLRAKQIAVQKLPERLEIVDALPMTAVGKVRKNVLREQIADIISVEQGSVEQGAGVSAESPR